MSTQAELIDHWADLLAWVAIGGKMCDLPHLGPYPDDDDDWSED